jgi:hypothetical protein
VTTLQSKEHVVAYTITAEPFRMYFNTPLSYQDIKAIRMEKDLQLKDAKIRVEEESCIYEFDNIYIVFKLLNEKPKGNLNGELVSERLVDIPPDILQYLAGFNNPLDKDISIISPMYFSLKFVIKECISFCLYCSFFNMVTPQFSS